MSILLKLLFGRIFLLVVLLNTDSTYYMLGASDTNINETCSLIKTIYTLMVETYLQRAIILIKGRYGGVMNL